MIIQAKKLPAHFFLGPDFYKMIKFDNSLLRLIALKARFLCSS